MFVNYILEMGQMSHWHSAAGLGRLSKQVPNVQPNVVCWDKTKSFTGDWWNYVTKICL